MSSSSLLTKHSHLVRRVVVSALIAATLVCGVVVGEGSAFARDGGGGRVGVSHARIGGFGRPVGAPGYRYAPGYLGWGAAPGYWGARPGWGWPSGRGYVEGRGYVGGGRGYIGAGRGGYRGGGHAGGGHGGHGR